MTDVRTATSRRRDPIDPVCAAESGYWRAGLRWKIVLHVMYYTDASRRRGHGHFFTIGHAWSEAAARARAAEIDDHLARCQDDMRQVAEAAAEPLWEHS